MCLYTYVSVLYTGTVRSRLETENDSLTYGYKTCLYCITIYDIVIAKYAAVVAPNQTYRNLLRYLHSR